MHTYTKTSGMCTIRRGRESFISYQIRVHCLLNPIDMTPNFLCSCAVPMSLRADEPHFFGQPITAITTSRPYRPALGSSVHLKIFLPGTEVMVGVL